MSTRDFIFCLVGGLISLFFFGLTWAQLDRASGDTRPPWYRRLFWRRTVGDLMAELEAGKRIRVSREEIELAKAYERRRMPRGLKFPKGGEIYEATSDFNVHYMTAYCAPFTGGGHAVLPRGERVRVCEPSSPEPLGVYCDPLNYDALHDRIVSAEEREHERYLNYYFSIDTVDLNRFFRLVTSQGTDVE